MAKTNTVRCPRCNRPQKKSTRDGAYYWCDHCKGQFDSEGDDGGDYFADPSKRLELAEERQKRAKERGRRR